ncbi:hypothetical protein C0995_003008 [Termitomyces sp. Mi166|nr:hypothetical protein C0995_003008 [Termitomyces sp. Mi166\
MGIRMQKKHPPLEVLIIAKHIKLGFKEKGKAKALLVNSKQTGAKQAFKSKELVDSDSDEEEEEKRVCVIKKIKHEHVEEPIGMGKGKEIIELEDLEGEMVVPKTPAVEPL